LRKIDREVNVMPIGMKLSLAIGFAMIATAAIADDPFNGTPPTIPAPKVIVTKVIADKDATGKIVSVKLVYQVQNWKDFDPRLFSADKALPCSMAGAPPSHTVLTMVNATTGIDMYSDCNLSSPHEISETGVQLFAFNPALSPKDPVNIPPRKIEITLTYRVVNSAGQVVNTAAVRSNTVDVKF
jgi:hypothetical protein